MGSKLSVNRDARRAGHSQATAGPAQDRIITAELAQMPEGTVGTAVPRLEENAPWVVRQPGIVVPARPPAGSAGTEVQPLDTAEPATPPTGIAGTAALQAVNAGREPSSN